MRTWAMRIIGLLNILAAIFGLLIEAVTLWIGGGEWPSSSTPMDWVIFALLLVTSVYLVVHPALYGIRLFKKDESTLLPCAVLLAVQILALLLFVWIGLSLPQSMHRIAYGLWSFAILPILYSVLYGPSVLGLAMTLTLLLLRKAATKAQTKNAVTSETIAGE